MKLLIVGLGSMGKRRARLAKGMDAAIEVVGVDSADARRAEAKDLGLVTDAWASIDEAVAAAHPDAALVCTSPLSHAAIIGELLDHDLPVFTELNLVRDGYAENMAKAKEKHLPLFLSSTMLYRRETQYIKKAVQDFGKPVHYIYHIGQYLPDWHPWENYKNFFVGNVRTGGVREIFGIDLPWLLDAFGDVEKMTVQTDSISDLGLPYPDCATLLLRHKSGAQGVLAADVVSPKAVRNFECFGDGLHLFWEGNPKALYEFRDGMVKEHLGTVAEFLERRKIENLNELERHLKPQSVQKPAEVQEKKTVSQQEYQARKFISKEERKRKNRIQFLEKSISDIETKMKGIEARLQSPTPDDDIMDLTREYLELKRDLDAKTDEWVALGSEDETSACQ